MAAETPEIVAAGQPEKKGKKTASQAEKRKAAEVESATDTPAVSSEGAEMVSDSPEAPAAKTAASRGRKRKSADDDTAAGAPSKKMKKETSKPTKPRQTKRKKAETSPPPPPPAPSPVEVTAPVQAKIDAVKQFLATEMAHENSMLERPSRQNPNLVSIPELDLLGVIMTMYFHYQLGHAETEASLADVDEAITDRYKAPLHLAGDVDWVTIDLSIQTAFETRIKVKIANHGLEEVSLLEVEMELCARQHRAQHDVYQWEAEKIVQTGDFLKDIVELGLDGWTKKDEVESLKGSDTDGREEGRIGVCPKPAFEVV